MKEKADSLQKQKKEYESQIQKEVDLKKGLEKQFKRSLVEKEILEGKLKEFYEDLGRVEQKMQNKIMENQKL